MLEQRCTDAEKTKEDAREAAAKVLPLSLLLLRCQFELLSRVQSFFSFVAVRHAILPLFSKLLRNINPFPQNFPLSYPSHPLLQLKAKMREVYEVRIKELEAGAGAAAAATPQGRPSTAAATKKK